MQILVIGGGIGGLTAAIALRGKGHAVTVIERCRYIVEKSLAICHGQIGKGPPVDNAVATHEMFELVAKSI